MHAVDRVAPGADDDHQEVAVTACPRAHRRGGGRTGRTRTNPGAPRRAKRRRAAWFPGNDDRIGEAEFGAIQLGGRGHAIRVQAESSPGLQGDTPTERPGASRPTGEPTLRLELAAKLGRRVWTSPD